MKLSLNTNIGSLTAQNQLLKANEKLQTSFERLSSGLRINRASDDPAGLAMASGLQTDSRLMAQAVRNVNDGISLLTIAESALKELNNILGRQAELAQQAANGTYTFEQRMALNEESDALTEEINRIINSTEFNGHKLFGDTPLRATIQGGIDSNSTIGLVCGEALAQLVGNGEFYSHTILTTEGSKTAHVLSVDVNNDGLTDLLAANATSGLADGFSYLNVYLSNGDGTFLAPSTFQTKESPTIIQSGDFNGDGILDVITADAVGDELGVLLGNGDGTFAARISSTGSLDARGLQIVDINNDGILDAITSSQDAKVTTHLGVGDGTFLVGTSYSVGLTPYLKVGDFNNDNSIDFITNNKDSDSLSLLSKKNFI